MVSRLLDIPLRRPRTVLAIIAALTVFFGFFALGIRVDSAVDNLLPAGNDDRLFYDGVRADFGSEEANVVALFGEDMFARESLAVIDRVSKAIESIEGVREVVSLTTMKGVESSEFGLRVGRLLKNLPETQAEAEEFRKKVFANPLYVGNVVSSDAKATGIVVLFDLMSDEQFIARNIEGQIETQVAATAGDMDYAITGVQSMKVRGAEMMKQDLTRFLPYSLILVIVVLAFSFRTVRGVTLPLSAVLIGVVWTLGLMVLSGRDINLGTLVLPPLLMAIGIAYEIHVVSRYYLEVESERTPLEMVEAAMAHSRLPVSIAAVTTLIGFASLLLSEIVAIRDFGTYAMFGIATIYLMAMFFVPAALVLMPRPQRGAHGIEYGGWMGAMLQKLGNFAIERRWQVLAVGALMAVAGAYYSTKIVVETDYLTFFDPSHPIVLENQRISDALGGTQPMYVVVDGNAPGSIGTIPMLTAIRDLQQFIAQLDGVDMSFSLADYVSLVHHALNPDSKHPLPVTEADLQQLLIFLDPEEVKPLVTRDSRRANILVRSDLSGSAAISKFVEDVEAFAKTRFPSEAKVRVTGTVVLLNRSADELAHGQVSGLFQVMVVLLIVMSTMFLSLRAGVISLVPNVFPIVLLFGLMGWSGISLNVATAMIAAIAIGIAVDDTIHYLATFNREVRLTGDPHKAVMQVAREVGRPIVFTAVALSAGFFVVCLSNFKPIQHFGLLAGVTMAIALFSDLFLLPALVMTSTIITVWDLLYVKLGPQPHKEIPLFQGLRPLQARIVVLMAQLASAQPGEFLTRRGELKEELYVLLNGAIDVRRRDGEDVIRVLGRGDVIGEMGLVRNRPRSATAIVRVPTEYLILDGGFLDRIQRRYPRIAAKVFLNLSRILSDRLESATERMAQEESR